MSDTNDANYAFYRALRYIFTSAERLIPDSADSDSTADIKQKPANTNTSSIKSNVTSDKLISEDKLLSDLVKQYLNEGEVTGKFSTSTDRHHKQS